MNGFTEVIADDINVPDLEFHVNRLWTGLNQPLQISLTTTTGDPCDWTSGNGYKPNPELFNKINPSLKDTYIEQLINRYPEYSRWRVMVMKPKTTLTVHKDCSVGKNYRIHIPVVSNEHSWMVFYQHKPCEGTQEVQHYHLEPGFVYVCNTTGFHTAVNYHHTSTRIHIIGERNE